MDTYTVKDRRWVIKSPATPGPDQKLIAPGTYEVTIDRQRTTVSNVALEPYGPIPLAAIDRLVEHSHNQPNGCILWDGALTYNGYGVIHLGTRNGRQNLIRVHRLAWLLAGGILPTNLRLNHTCHSQSDCNDSVCDHRRCISVSHLELSSAKFNNSRENSRRWAA